MGVRGCVGPLVLLPFSFFPFFFVFFFLLFLFSFFFFFFLLFLSSSFCLFFFLFFLLILFSSFFLLLLLLLVFFFFFFFFSSFFFFFSFFNNCSCCCCCCCCCCCFAFRSSLVSFCVAFWLQVFCVVLFCVATWLERVLCSVHGGLRCVLARGVVLRYVFGWKRDSQAFSLEPWTNPTLQPFISSARARRYSPGQGGQIRCLLPHRPGHSA